MQPTPVEATPYRQMRANGRLHEPGVQKGDAQTAVLCHLFVAMGVFGGVLLIVPPILWLTSRDRSSFVDDHGREACNFTLSMLLWSVILFVSVIGTIISWMPLAIMVIWGIRSAVIASHREYVRYPMTLRIL